MYDLNFYVGSFNKDHNFINQLDVWPTYLIFK